MECDHIFIDFEATGLNPKIDQIIEVAAIRTDFEGNQQCAYWQRVKPTIPVSESAASVNGYNEADWEEAVDFKTMIKGFNSILFHNRSKKYVLVAHEARFEQNMLVESCSRENVEYPFQDYHRWICTRTLAWPLIYSGCIDSASLKPVAEYYGVRFQGKQHTASADVDVCMRVYFEMMLRYKIMQQAENKIRTVADGLMNSFSNMFRKD